MLLANTDLNRTLNLLIGTYFTCWKEVQAMCVQLLSILSVPLSSVASLLPHQGAFLVRSLDRYCIFEIAWVWNEVFVYESGVSCPYLNQTAQASKHHALLLIRKLSLQTRHIGLCLEEWANVFEVSSHEEPKSLFVYFLHSPQILPISRN